MHKKAPTENAPPKLEFTVIEQKEGYALHANGKPMQTPGKHPLSTPVKALTEAICWEWQSNDRFDSTRMPLTSLVYTALDRIAGQEEAIIEALLVYVETDTLSYRDSGENALLARKQKEHWDPVLAWLEQHLGVAMATNSGIMPMDQPKQLVAAFKKELEKLDIMQLSATSVLSACCSSVILALAVVCGHMDGQKAFELSQLEEEVQAQVWGHDAQADERALRLKNEIVAASRFLRLLERQ